MAESVSRFTSSAKRRIAGSLRVPIGLAVLALAIPANFLGVPSAFAKTSVAAHFVWTATDGNILGVDGTEIKNKASNGHPKALLFVTPNYDPNGVDRTYDTSPVGVYYRFGHWIIFNENESSMTAGDSFNVLVVPKETSSVFVQRATSKTTFGDSTSLNSHQANGKPKAEIQVTQVWNPSGGGGIYNDHPVGVWYFGKHWRILNEDGSAMTLSVAFNVMVGNSAAKSGTLIVQKTTAGNRYHAGSFVSSTKTNGHPKALVFDTPNWNPGGKGGTYDSVATGVLYSGSSLFYPRNRWAVVNEDNSVMALHAAFNLLVFPN